MSRWFKKLMDHKTDKLNIHKPIMLSKLLKKENSFKGKEMSLVERLMRLRKN